jgi:hypothetical protein
VDVPVLVVYSSTESVVVMYRYQQSWGCPDLDKSIVKTGEDTNNIVSTDGHMQGHTCTSFTVVCSLLLLIAIINFDEDVKNI